MRPAEKQNCGGLLLCKVTGQAQSNSGRRNFLDKSKEDKIADKELSRVRETSQLYTWESALVPNKVLARYLVCKESASE